MVLKSTFRSTDGGIAVLRAYASSQAPLPPAWNAYGVLSRTHYCSAIDAQWICPTKHLEGRKARRRKAPKDMWLTPKTTISSQFVLQSTELGLSLVVCKC